MFFAVFDYFYPQNISWYLECSGSCAFKTVARSVPFGILPLECAVEKTSDQEVFSTKYSVNGDNLAMCCRAWDRRPQSSNTGDGGRLPAKSSLPGRGSSGA